MADRATIDTMNKVLDNLFGTKKYAGGTPQGVSPPGRGNPTQSQDRLKEYVDELLLAGMDPREVSNMLASSHATMKGRAFDELYIKQMTDDLQKHVQLRQQPLKPEIQSFQASRNPTVSNFLKIAATKGHTVDIDNVIKAFGINDPRMVESYKNEAYAARSQNAFPRLINFLKQFQNDPAKLASTLRTLKQVKTNNPIFEQISWIPQLGNTVARPVRMLVKATETGLGSSGMGLSQSQMRNYTKPSTPSANLSSISLPSNPAASTQRLAAQFVAEQRRQQAMQQASNVGRSISRSNFLKTLARQNKSSGQASTVDLNFLGSRSTHQPTLFDRLRESKLGRRLGFESTNPVNYKAAGVGLAGGLSYLAMQYAPQAIDALSSGLAYMASGFFARGGSVPGYAYGGDPLRNIHLTKSPESASKLIGSNVVNSLQSDANSTGLYGLLQSMIKSGSTDASFRGLFYRKGLDANTWMEKVHQMKLQEASTFMNGYFAKGGNVLNYSIGGSLAKILPSINIRMGKHDPLFNINRLLKDGKAYYNDWASEKRTYSLTKGKDARLMNQVADMFNEVIVKNLSEQYDPEKHSLKYNVLDPRMEKHVITLIENMPDSWKQAMAVATTNKPALFSGFESIKGKSNLLGRYYPSSNHIFAKLGNKKIQNTLQHEVSHLLFESAPLMSKIEASKRIKQMGLKIDNKDYWKRPTEILARAIGYRGKYANGGLIPRYAKGLHMVYLTHLDLKFPI